MLAGYLITIPTEEINSILVSKELGKRILEKEIFSRVFHNESITDTHFVSGRATSEKEIKSWRNKHQNDSYKAHLSKLYTTRKLVIAEVIISETESVFVFLENNNWRTFLIDTQKTKCLRNEYGPPIEFPEIPVKVISYLH